MANEVAGQDTTRAFWKSLIAKNGQPGTWLGRCVVALADMLGRETNPTMLQGYVAYLSRLTPQECVEAFTRAGEELRYFPPPAVLLDLAGRAPARYARPGMVELAAIIAHMRVNGAELRDKLGAVTATRGPEGQYIAPSDYPREPMTPAPAFDEVTEAAIRILGFGDRMAGLAVVADHPALPWNAVEAEGKDASFRRRDAERLEERWCDAWAQAKGGAR